MKHDPFAAMTDELVQMLDTVDPADYQLPWVRSAGGGMPFNPVTGNTYRGGNVIMLWMKEATHPEYSNYWAGFHQWKQLGAHVGAGQKCSHIYSPMTLKKTDSAGEESSFTMFKAAKVWNASQVVGWQAPSTDDLPNLAHRIETIDDFITGTGAEIEYGRCDRAFYAPSQHSIHMPETARFKDTHTGSATEHYYATLFHELTHWTGGKPLLDRNFGADKADYAFEELIAELGAAFHCAHFNIKTASRVDHAQYLKSWLRALKNEPKFIFDAARSAQSALDLTLSLAQRSPADDEGHSDQAIARTPGRVSQSSEGTGPTSLNHSAAA